ncbi:MAG: hypothetical protein L0287_12640 [Anaerolineae bacterium]|nr:hypothetical protein [Anaerolineae bacterium]
MAVTLSITQAQILGAALVEILSGKLTDETIAAVDTINRDDVPEPLNTLVGYMHGMSTYEPLRESQITSLLTEIRGAATEVLEKRVKHPTPVSSDWMMMYNILETILDGGNYDLRGMADMSAEVGLDIANVDRVPAWAQSLIMHIQNSNTQGDELTLELLDILEKIIQQRKAQLK